MAQQTTVHYVSDLSGKDITDNDAPTVRYAWDGVDYEIDLTADEAEKMYKALEKYLSVSRKAPKTNGTRRKGASTSTGPSAAEIRAWAQSNGHEVPERGRIPAAVREAFESAN